MATRTSRRGGAAPTLSDVAHAAGVSPMTVSRVINKDSKVREPTRERVLAAIEALDYSPNAAARSLAGGLRTRIALFFGNPSAAYLSEVLVGCLTEATRSDVQLLLERCQSWEEATQSAARVIERGLDGVLLPPPFCDRTDLVEMLLDAGMPVAAIAGGATLGNAFGVMINDTKAAFDMTTHLIALGHQRIGFIAGNPNQVASGKRLEGYRAALRQSGLAAERDLVVQGDFSYRSGLHAAEQLLELSPPPSAIFASNDDMAAAAIAVAHRKHLDVPNDVSVCGFDDTVLATTISPELTTVRQPAEEMAQAAIAMLATASRRRRSGEIFVPEKRLFAHRIVRRESDAPPRH